MMLALLVLTVCFWLLQHVGSGANSGGRMCSPALAFAVHGAHVPRGDEQWIPSRSPCSLARSACHRTRRRLSVETTWSYPIDHVAPSTPATLKSSQPDFHVSPVPTCILTLVSSLHPTVLRDTGFRHETNGLSKASELADFAGSRTCPRSCPASDPRNRLEPTRHRSTVGERLQKVDRSKVVDGWEEGW